MEEYPDNSISGKRGDNVKPSPKSDETKVVKSVVTGTVTKAKKPLSRRMKEIFFSGDVDSVWAFLRDQVLVPALKDTISEVVSQGVDRTLYGDRGYSSGGRSSGRSRGYTNYNQISSRRGGNEPSARQARARVDNEPLLFSNRVDAEMVIDQIKRLHDRYGQVSVADLYHSANMTPLFTDENWGWYDIRGFSVQRISGGYLVNFPAPEPLD